MNKYELLGATVATEEEILGWGMPFTPTPNPAPQPAFVISDKPSTAGKASESRDAPSPFVITKDSSTTTATPWRTWPKSSHTASF